MDEVFVPPFEEIKIEIEGFDGLSHEHIKNEPELEIADDIMDTMSTTPETGFTYNSTLTKVERKDRCCCQRCRTEGRRDTKTVYRCQKCLRFICVARHSDQIEKYWCKENCSD